MGLDMRPMGKPKLGFEERFEQIFRLLDGKDKQKLSFLDKLKGKKLPTKEELKQEWFDIQIPTYETIKAPRVGRDKEANEWIKQKYLETDRIITEEEFVKKFEGYYVIELAKEKDGVPLYISLQQDENVFRGQFLRLCEDVIGEDLVNEAWETKFAAEALNYGKRLEKAAEKIAVEKKLEYLKDQYLIPDANEDTLEFKLHIIYSLSKWLIFYGKNGHGYEADF